MKRIVFFYHKAIVHVTGQIDSVNMHYKQKSKR